MDLRIRKVSLCAVIGVLGPASVPLGLGTSATLEHPSGAARLLGHRPPLFVENRGQAPGTASFTVPGRDRTLAFSPSGFTLSVSSRTDSSQRRHDIRMEFVDGRKVPPAPLEQQVTRMSWFRGRPDQWITGAPTSRGVRYREVWPGIDAV